MRVIRAAPISGAVAVSALAILLVAGCADESAMPATGGANDGSAETAARLLAELTARREQMPGREVYVMRDEAAPLSEEQRLQVAEYLAGRTLAEDETLTPLACTESSFDYGRPPQAMCCWLST